MNQDYLGINDKSGYDPAATFSSLGIVSTVTTPNAVPEPGTSGLLALSAGLILGIRRATDNLKRLNR
jgi:nitrate reductase gamma subunit